MWATLGPSTARRHARIFPAVAEERPTRPLCAGRAAAGSERWHGWSMEESRRARQVSVSAVVWMTANEREGNAAYSQRGQNADSVRGPPKSANNAAGLAYNIREAMTIPRKGKPADDNGQNCGCRARFRRQPAKTSRKHAGGRPRWSPDCNKLRSNTVATRRHNDRW